MKTNFLTITGMILLSFSIGSVYGQCSEQDRDACIGSDGKFDYGAYWDSFWEPAEIQHSFEKNSTATFEHKKDELGFRGTINATQEDVITITVPRSMVDSIHRNCDPDQIDLLVKYEKPYANTTFYDGFYQDSLLADQDQIVNQTHRIVTFTVLPTMSFEFIGMFPLGLVGEMFDTCGALNGYLTYYAPPKFQIGNGVEPWKVKCNDTLTLLMHPSEGRSVCVTGDTAKKLIERGWTTTSSDTLRIQYVFEVSKDDKIFDVHYTIKDGTLLDMAFDADANSLLVAIDSIGEGKLTLGLPRDLIDTELYNCLPVDHNPYDEQFFVLLDGEEISYDEISSSDENRTIQIQFDGDSSIAEIIPLCLI